MVDKTINNPGQEVAGKIDGFLKAYPSLIEGEFSGVGNFLKSLVSPAASADATPATKNAPTGTTAPATATPVTTEPVTSPVTSAPKTVSPAIPPQTGTPPSGASQEDVAAYYQANPLFLRLGESQSQYLARTQGTGTASSTKTDASDSGFISAKDQSSIADGMSGMTDEELNSGGSALDAFNSASGSSSTASGSLQDEIESEMKDIMTNYDTPPVSLQTTYNNLLASSGLNADQQSLLNMSTIMNGTEDDIRAELTNNGGFVTESQIEALTNERNKNLQKQYTTLQNGLQTKQAWIDDQMKYIQADQTEADTQFEKKYSLINNLQSTLEKLQATDATTYYRFQTQQMNQLNTMLKYGTNLSSDQIAAYSASTGIDVASLTAANKSATARYALTNSIDNANIALKQIQIRNGGISTSKILALNTNGVPTGATSIITQGYAQGESADTITAALEKQYPGQGASILSSYNDVMGTKNMTGTNIDPTTQAQLMADIGTGKYSLAQLEAAYKDVDPTYIASQITAAAN
jgi:hypothetical protein